MKDCLLNKAEFDAKNPLQRAAIVMEFGKAIYTETRETITVEIFLVKDFYAAMIFALNKQQIIEVRSVAWKTDDENKTLLASLTNYNEN